MEQPLNDINLDAWKEWTDYRKGKRKPVSENARGKQWQMLAQYDHAAQQRIIDHSIRNDYQGLFPTKEQATRNSTRARTLEYDLFDRSWAK